MQRCGPEAEGEVTVGRAVEDDLVGAFELVLVVVRGEPADEDPIVLAQRVAARRSTSLVTVRLNVWFTDVYRRNSSAAVSYSSGWSMS